MNIGIDENSKLVYEGVSTYGHPLWPSPVLLQVGITSEENPVFSAEKYNNFPPNSLIFREESYDSSSRVRRGRLYKAGNSQPTDWNVYPHPAVFREQQTAVNNGGTIQKWLFTFYSLRLHIYLRDNNIRHPLFILGAENGFTIWTLINIETSATGDELIALKARKSIGALPHLDREKIQAADAQVVIELIETLEDDLYRAGPESIVDRAREATTAILSNYLQNQGKTQPGNDLSKLAGLMLDEKFEVVANTARTIARFHSRAKSAEQEKRSIRRITEQDAEFAVQGVGVILCEIGWAKW
tara:strand:- start:5637 stop:6533 length:897 start_codon:yes stop_codon:yes gene_type:complete